MTGLRLFIIDNTKVVSHVWSGRSCAGVRAIRHTRGVDPLPGECDVVVVGGGAAGLTAGGLLARAGRSVVVVEAESRPGGYLRSIECDGYSFDRAVQLVMGCNPDGPFGPGLIWQVLDALGVAGRVDAVRVDPFYVARLPGFALQVPTGREAYIQAHARVVGAEERRIADLVDLCSRLFREFADWPVRPGPLGWATAPFRFPRLVRDVRSTSEAVMRRYLRDPRLRALYGALSLSYVGTPPSSASFLTWAVMMASYVEEGAFYWRGGFQRLADALAAGVCAQGGTLAVGRRVEEIVIEHGRACGVRLDDGRVIRARAVVAAIDSRQTFDRLLDPALLPRRWRRRLDRTPLSPSFYTLYLGTNLDAAAVGAPFLSLLVPGWDLDEAGRCPQGGIGSDLTVTIPTLLDPSLAPQARHQVIIAGTAPPDEARVDHGAVAADYVRRAEAVLPGLREHLAYAVGANNGPSGPDRLPLHRFDAVYGWANTPSASGPFRLSPTTPIRGLVLAGQWTQPGFGVWTVVASGIQASRLVLGQGLRAGLGRVDQRQRP